MQNANCQMKNAKLKDRGLDGQSGPLRQRLRSESVSTFAGF
jgi:hypothetical protein